MSLISQEMKTTYLQRRRTDIEKCRSALSMGEFDLIARVGHKMKGNAETFGFHSLETIGTELEKAAEENDPANISQLLVQLGNVVDELSPEGEVSSKAEY